MNMSSKSKGLVAVPAELRQFAGAITMWRLHGDVDPDALSATMSAQGLQHIAPPALPGPDAALRRALDEFRARRVLVRPLKNRGAWSLVSEELDGDDVLHHAQTCTVTLDGVGRLSVSALGPGSDNLRDRIAEEYVRHSTMYSAHDVSAWLIAQCNRLAAVSIRDGGGVYFIPRANLPEWERITRAAQSANASTFCDVPALPTESVVRAVLDAMRAEAEQAYAAIEEEINDGKLGARALASRAERCSAIAAKIVGYEELLDAKMTDLRAKLSDLQAGIAAAILKSDTAEEGAAA
jgi:hypothetical protein